MPAKYRHYSKRYVTSDPWATRWRSGGRGDYDGGGSGHRHDGRTYRSRDDGRNDSYWRDRGLGTRDGRWSRDRGDDDRDDRYAERGHGKNKNNGKGNGKGHGKKKGQGRDYGRGSGGRR